MLLFNIDVAHIRAITDYDDIIMGTIAPQIISLTIVYWKIYSGT